MNLIGMSLKRQIIGMMTKYGYEFETDIVISDINRLTNQIWKIIPMYENTEDWQKQLITATIEISGLGKIFLDKIEFLELLSKLEGLQIQDVSFEILRKTVFESIALLQELKQCI